MAQKVLFTATVVKTHIMQFHIPYLQLFQQMGWETAVAARNDYEDPAECRIPYCDAHFDIPFERTPWKKGNIAAYKKLKSIIDEGNYDIIHCHTPVGAILTRIAARQARKKGTKVVYTAHGFHFFKGAPLRNWLMFYPAEWLTSFLTDVLITINKEDYARAQKHMHARRIEYVPGVGIDTDRFRCAEVDRAEKRRSLGFGEADYLMLTVAEMTPNKNHITILRAMARMKDSEEYKHMHYLICGRGVQWKSLEQSAKELGISDHVHFLGYRTDVRELYRSSDLFLFIPFREGLSVALMEAMSSALPIICSEIRGNTDLIDDKVSGEFVPSDPAAVADKILQLYRDPDYAKKLGQAAAEKVKIFGMDNVRQKMKDIYLSL